VTGAQQRLSTALPNHPTKAIKEPRQPHPGAMAAPALQEGDFPVAFSRGGWNFEARERPLWGTERTDELIRERALCAAPDMFCGDALVKIVHPASSTVVELSAADAFRCCSWKPAPPVPLQPPYPDGDSCSGPLLGTVQCQFADKWRPHGANPDVKELEVTSDWTCSTAYWGSFYDGDGETSPTDPSFITAGEETDENLPMDLLRRQDEIHWYQHVLFWEDELGDNGLCRLSVRVRVMPTFWFALLLCELRVDNVLLREVATRLFCSFDKDYILREWTWKEATYETLKNRGVMFKDNPEISQTNIGTILLKNTDIQRQLRHKIYTNRNATIGGNSTENSA